MTNQARVWAVPRSSTQATDQSSRKWPPSPALPAAILTLTKMALEFDHASRSKSSSRPLFRSCALTSLFRTSTTLTAPAGMQTTPLNPSVGEFHPNTPQHDPFVNTSFSTSGRGHSMPSAAPPTHYISQNMGGTVYFLRAIPSDQEEPQQELIQHQFPSSAGTRYNRRNMNLNQHMAATTRDLHKSGNPCPEGSGWCHWHYARWCHEDPATCHLARKFLSFLLIIH